MSIYHKNWSVDEEITSDSLNQMARDADNTTDNLHTQYADTIRNLKIGASDPFVYIMPQYEHPGGMTPDSDFRGYIYNVAGGLWLTEFTSLSRMLQQEVRYQTTIKKRKWHTSLNLNYYDAIETNIVGAGESYAVASSYGVQADGTSLGSGSFTPTTSPASRSIDVNVSGVADNTDIVITLAAVAKAITTTNLTNYSPAYVKVELTTLKITLS